MLTADYCRANGLYIARLGITLHTNLWIYTYIYKYRLYMYILSLETVYIAYKYMFAALICWFLCLLGALYMEMHVLLYIIRKYGVNAK